MASSFKTIPKGALVTPKPFEVAIPDKVLSDMRTLLELSPIADPTYENSFSDRRLGIDREWLVKAKQTWLTSFDWRKQEAHINSFPHWTTPIEDDNGEEYNIHFVGLFSEKPDAIPVFALHGWPGNFLEFLPMMDLLRKQYSPSDLPYHFVVPSLPGYAFSSRPPLDTDWNTLDIARIFNKLAVSLGFGDGYAVQGGDIGSRVARLMGVHYTACKVVHLNFCNMQEPAHPLGTPNDLEKGGLKRGEEFVKTGRGYAVEHGTRPSTISFALTSSPLALLAWIGEKFLEWTDENPSIEEILTSVTLYWVTRCFPTTIYTYREAFSPNWKGGAEDPGVHLKVPLGYSWFIKELVPMPESWVATTGDLVFYRQHTKGGHFAALEQSEVLLEDLRDFLDKAWPKALAK